MAEDKTEGKVAEEEAQEAPQTEGEDDGSLPSNVAAALCYLLGHVTGIVFLLVEKEDAKVRFHAMQAVVTSLGLWFLLSATTWVPIVGPILERLQSPIAVVAIAGLAYVAYTEKEWRMPFFGKLAANALAAWDECGGEES